MLQELEEMLDADKEATLWENCVYFATCTLKKIGITWAQAMLFWLSRIKTTSAHSNSRSYPTYPRLHSHRCTMHSAFRTKLQITLHWVMIHCIAILTGIEPQWFHRHSNSCMAYTGKHSHLQHCCFWKEPQLNSVLRLHRLFCYLPHSLPSRFLHES
jgi:hypothetical protein